MRSIAFYVQMIIFIEILHPVTFVNIKETFPCKVFMKLLIHQNSWLDFGNSNACSDFILSLSQVSDTKHDMLRNYLHKCILNIAHHSLWKFCVTSVLLLITPLSDPMQLDFSNGCSGPQIKVCNSKLFFYFSTKIYVVGTHKNHLQAPR